MQLETVLLQPVQVQLQMEIMQLPLQQMQMRLGRKPLQSVQILNHWLNLPWLSVIMQVPQLILQLL